MNYINSWTLVERGKRGFNHDKQVERVVTVLNHVLKGSWEEGGSGGTVRGPLTHDSGAHISPPE